MNGNDLRQSHHVCLTHQYHENGCSIFAYTDNQTTKYKTLAQPAHNFKRHSYPTRVSNYRKPTNKVLYTSLFIGGRAKLINRFYNRSSYKGERIIQGKMSRLRKSKKGNITKNLRLSHCCQLKFQFSIMLDYVDS